MQTRSFSMIIILALTMTLVGCILPGGNPVVSPPPDPNPESPLPGNDPEEPPAEEHPPDIPPGEVPTDAEIPGGGDIPEPGDIEALIAYYSFLSYPIRGGQVSSFNGQLPNAPRSYRNGVHQGLDFYDVSRGTPVLAAAEGVVIRADHGYTEMTMEKYNEIIQVSMQESITPEEILDMLRGRQVWIEHQHGIITRYAHLDSVAAAVTVGEMVEKGQEIGTVGDSGSKSGVAGQTLSASGAPHLHFEIWQANYFLGQGLTPEEVRHIYREVLAD